MPDDVCITPQIDCDHMGALMQAIHSADICVLYQTPDLVYRWAENLPVILQDKWHEGCRDSDLLSAEIAENMETTKLQILGSSKGTSLEVRLTEEEEPVWFKFSIDCHRNKNGKIMGLITTGVNVSELRRREQVLKILLREVSHRSKNLLAIMQSIAVQTARFSDNVGSFLTKFQGRIQSMSHSQDLVTDSNWRGALFQDLVRSQASSYVDFENSRFLIKGKNPYLFPGAALHIGLAFHELIINSTSYGALASEQGEVKVTCAVMKPESEDSNVRICWEETFPPADCEEQNWKSRFGSTVLERIVPASVNGEATYEIDCGKVTYRLTMPTSQFDI